MADGDKADVKPKITNGAIPKVNNTRASLSTPRERLPSFKPPRDLSLGLPKTGTGPALASLKPRKAFAPTIPVRRDRSKEKEDDHRSSNQYGRHRDDRRGGRGRGERGRGRGGKDRNSLIQTMGNVFGEGLGDVGKRRGASGGGYGGGSGGSRESSRDEPNFIPMPKLNLQHDKKVDHEEESAKLRELLRDDFIDDPFPDPEPNFIPVQLPMLDAGSTFYVKKENEEMEDVKEAIKSEEGDDDGVNGVKIKKEKVWEDGKEVEESVENIAAFIKTEVMDDQEDEEEKKKRDLKKVKMKKVAVKKPRHNFEPTVADLFHKDEGELFLMQLPDCLPGLGPEKEKGRPGSSKPKQDASASTSTAAESKESEVSPFCSLSTLPEGCLGKLQILKSGRVRLVLGQHSLHVDLGTQVGFLQEAVSVSLDEQTKSGQMTVLGHVNRRLVITPDWDVMLSQMSLR